MAENIFSTFDISSEGMSAQRLRLSAVAKNIANANTTKSVDGKPYQREIVLIKHNQNTFNEELQQSMHISSSENSNNSVSQSNSTGIRQKLLDTEVTFDTSEPRSVYDPSHPDADEKGYVLYPNINVVTEMVEMISAQRAFEANTQIIEAAKNIARNSLEI